MPREHYCTYCGEPIFEKNIIRDFCESKKCKIKYILTWILPGFMEFYMIKDDMRDHKRDKEKREAFEKEQEEDKAKKEGPKAPKWYQ